jgi:hypothetical protein
MPVALKALINSLDEVDEAFRSEYKESGDKFVLDVTGIGEHPDAVALKRALDRERDAKKAAAAERDALKQRVEGLPEDFTVETFNDLQNRLAGADPKAIDERLQRQREADARKLEQETSARDKRIAKLDSVLNRTLIDDGLRKELAAQGVEPKLMSAAIALLKTSGKVKLVEDDEGFQVVADDGIDEKAPLTTFVASWASSEDGKAFVAQASGGGATGGTGVVFTDNPWDSRNGKKPNLTRQQELVRTNPEKARQMARAVNAPVTW